MHPTMKNFLTLVSIGLLSFAFLGSANSDPQLNIEIHNIKKLEGQILVAIYNDKEHYLDADYAIPAKATVTQLGSMTRSVDLAFGN